MLSAALPRIPILPIGVTPKLRPREKYIQRVALINEKARMEGWDVMKLLHRLHTNRYRMERWMKRHGLPTRWITSWDQQYRGLELFRRMKPMEIYKLMWWQAYNRERKAARLGA